MFILSLFVFLIVFLSLYLLYRYARFRWSMEQIAPGPAVASLWLGNFDRFIRKRNLSEKEHLQNQQSFGHLFATYREGGVMRVWLGPFKVVYFLTKAEFVQKLLASQVHLNKGVAYSFLSAWLGDGLFTANATIWRPRRRLLLPGFHRTVLNASLATFRRHTAILLSTIDSQLERSEVPCLEIDNLLGFFESLAFNIVKEGSLGVGEASGSEETGSEASSLAYRQALKSAFFTASQRMTTPLFWFDCFFARSAKGRTFARNIATMNSYAESVIYKRAQVLSAQGKLASEAPSKGTILLDILLRKADESPQEMPLKTMIEEVNTILLGGYDTVAIALTFTTLLLGHHLEIQDGVFEELQSIFEDSLERDITVDDLRRMRHLEMVIKESLRLYPSLQTIGRTLCGPLELPNGAILPGGSTVLINLDSYHRDPEYFPQPEAFRPERFAPDALTPIPPYAFLPFSAGPRSCIGQRYAMLELKFVLASILRKYRVISVTEPETIIRAVLPTLKPLTNIVVRLERRGAKAF